MQRRIAGFVALLFVLTVCALLLFFDVDFGFLGAVDASASVNKTVIIDPGHGGEDGGAVGIDGTVEKDINLSLSHKLRQQLGGMGFTVIMSRIDDRALYGELQGNMRSKKVADIHNRFKLIEDNPRAIFLSIHQNKFTAERYSGAQVFYSVSDYRSRLLAESIQNAVATLVQPENKREIKPAGTNLYILHNAKTVAVMVECGFLSALR